MGRTIGACEAKLSNKINTCYVRQFHALPLDKRLDIVYTGNMKNDYYRLSILDRDGFVCVLCGSKKKLQVHHKDLMGTTKPSKEQNNDDDNLITLCNSCHMKLHYNTFGRDETIRDLRLKGLTFAAIGKIFNISRQRVHEIIRVVINR